MACTGICLIPDFQQTFKMDGFVKIVNVVWTLKIVAKLLHALAGGNNILESPYQETTKKILLMKN